MSNESSRHSRADDRHRGHKHSHHSRESRKLDDNVDEQPEYRRHHRHKHRRSRRSLSPGEIPPPKKHRSRRLSPGEIPPPRRHRSRDSDRRHNKRTETPKLQVKDPSPENDLPEEKVNPSQSPADIETSDSDEIFGPMPAQQEEIKRAPRRGEYGHDAKDIERFEQMGFVMSGNRRKRKHQQNADEASKKADFKVQKEEKALREMELVAKFKEMIQNRKEE